MPEEIEIELFNEQEEEQNEVQLPLNYITVGEVENDDLKVYIHLDVFKKLEEFAASDLDHELGSILLGEYVQAMGKTHVVISRYIEAKYTDSSASTLTFTHETWDYIHAQHEKEYPELRILGWQHTHPGYGIFLSNYDLFIQENFFNLPFQVAYVIDPKQKLRGFFQWKNDKIEKLNGFYVYDEVGKPVKLDFSKLSAQAESKPEAIGRKRSPYITIALLAAVVLLCGAAFLQGGRIRSQAQAQDELYSVVNRQNGEIRALQAERANAGDPTTADASKDASRVTFVQYTVEPGDTLYGICRKNGLDYASVQGTIRSLNGIEDVDQIHTGQTLILPQFN